MGTLPKKKPIGELYAFTMGANIFMAITGFAGFVVLLNFSIGSIHTTENNIEGIFGIVASLALLFVGLYSLQHIMVLSKDYKSLKNKNFISVTGRVIKFRENKETESGLQINNQPIIEDIETGEEIVLVLNEELRLGEVYRFNYLPNSHIAEVL